MCLHGGCLSKSQMMRGMLGGVKLPWRATPKLLKGVWMRISNGILEWMLSELHSVGKHVIWLMRPVTLSTYGRLHGELVSIEAVQCS